MTDAKYERYDEQPLIYPTLPAPDYLATIRVANRASNIADTLLLRLTCIQPTIVQSKQNVLRRSRPQEAQPVREERGEAGGVRGAEEAAMGALEAPPTTPADEGRPERHHPRLLPPRPAHRRSLRPERRRHGTPYPGKALQRVSKFSNDRG